MEKYIGKTCPYCKTKITEGETFVVCDVCDMPHHLSCWQDNKGCSTFGCTGYIKQVFGAEVQPQLTSPNINAAPSTQSEKPLEKLFESNDLIFTANVPVTIENTAIIIDRTKDKLFARCAFRSLTDKPLRAVLVKIHCKDVWGNLAGEPVAFQYLDLKTANGTTFGRDTLVELPDKTTRNISIVIEKVMLEDGTLLSGGNDTTTMPAPVLLNKHLANNSLVAEYARETTPKAKFVPSSFNEYWRCTCGALNDVAELKCYDCGCTMEQLTAALDPEALNANMIRFAEEKRLTAQREQAEREERIRLAEEQVRIERERKEREFKKAQEEELLKKRKETATKRGIISLIVAVALGCVAIFYGIPYYNYQLACTYLNNGDYDLAYSAFEALGDFKDSEEMATKSRYEKATSLMKSKDYESAYKVLKELGNYKDSEEKMTECIYAWVDRLLSSGTISELNDFKSSVTLKTEHYSMVYSKIWNKINSLSLTVWDYSASYYDVDANLVYNMLQLLPSSYQQTDTLTKLFKVLKDQNITADYIRNNSSFFKSVWSLDIVKDFLLDDDNVAYFLDGHWSTYSGDYYLEFYQNSDGGTSSYYNLPTPEKPAATKYYDIRSLVYVWEDSDGDKLKDVFRFTVDSYDTLKVYCYKNGRTYTLYR